MRDEVRSFAQAMEERMAEFDAKKGEEGWKGLELPTALFDRLKSKLGSLERANDAYQKAYARRVPRPDLEPLRAKVLQVAADVGNYAMLIADVCDALPLEGE